MGSDKESEIYYNKYRERIVELVSEFTGDHYDINYTLNGDMDCAYCGKTCPCDHIILANLITLIDIETDGMKYRTHESF